MDASVGSRSAVAVALYNVVTTRSIPRTDLAPSLPFSSKRCSSILSCSRSLQSMASRTKKSIVVRASSSSSSSDSAASIAPLKLESPVGQFLSQMLMSHPHLLPAAVDQQLEQLQADRDTDQEKHPQDAESTDIVLYKRIADVRANERKKVVEEILYALVVKKFMDANVSLIPGVVPSPSGHVDTWLSQEEKLKQLHSPEAYEMIQNHIALVLGNNSGNADAVAQISKLRVGQVYAASVMYGYFLKRIDQRYQLDKAMKLLPGTVDEKESDMKPDVEVSSFSGGFGVFEVKASRLRAYVMSLDGETLQRYATIRSKEAVGMIEKHTEALFGKPEIVISPQGTIDSSTDEEIKISFGGLKKLVLEAVTFGSFVWDVESYVDSRYRFVTN